MTPERWERIKDLLEAALELSPEERPSFLDRACHGDESLRAELERLLGQHEQAASFLESPPLPSPISASPHESRRTFTESEVVNDRFKIIRFIGQGGMGEVYAAEDVELHERVALKALRPEIAGDPQAIERLKREIHLARSIAHPNVCRVFDLGHHHKPEGSEVWFLTMELLEGETLAERLKRVGRMSTTEAWPLVEQMAAGLDAAHQAGVVHRDFKPGNVIVTQFLTGTLADRTPSPPAPLPQGGEGRIDSGLPPSPSGERRHDSELPPSPSGEGRDDSELPPSPSAPANSGAQIPLGPGGVVKVRAVITDFGLARATDPAAGDRLTGSASHILGTPDYMAPEQVEDGPITPATDTYALGIVLYEMVSGALPFVADTPLARAVKRTKEPPTPLRAHVPGLDSKWEAAILRCLKRDPADRFANASDVVAALRGESVPRRIGRPLRGERLRVKPRAALLAALLVTAIGLALWWALPRTRPSVPELSNQVPLTEDGREKGPSAVTDASWLYFDERVGFQEHAILAKVRLSGGHRQEIETGFHNVHLLGISPDKSQLMVAKVESNYRGASPTDTVWLLPTSGGSPHPLGEVASNAAAWSPDGQRIAYAKGGELWEVDADGSNPRRIATAHAQIDPVFWSPDGTLLRFYTSDSAIWEVRPDGSGFRKWFPGLDSEGFGISPLGWTPDGKYFVVMRNDSTTWILPEKPGFLARMSTKPMQLLSGQRKLLWISHDGKKAYVAEGGIVRYTLVTFDPQVNATIPLKGFSGVSAQDPSFSRDGEWIAYSKGDPRELWRSRADGIGLPLRLTSDRLEGSLPAWSPDSRELAFMGGKAHEPRRIYLISPDGGSPKLLVPDNLWPIDPNAQSGWQGAPSWSPDGTQIAFGENGRDFPIPPTCAIHIYDLHTQRLSSLPGSDGLWTARWSPDGRYLAATARDNEKLMLYDFKTQKWSQLDDGFIGDNPAWSHDGKYLYYMKPYGDPPAMLRIRLPGGKPERVADLSVLAQRPGTITKWSSLTPKGALLLINHDADQEIYAYDLKLP
jgi:serine/threonine protein kinase/Tol biopolymer transport system component